MKKLLAFLGLTIIAMLTACTNDNLDAIAEAGDNAMGVGKGEVPVLLSIGAGAQTRSPLESVGSNFATPTGASPEDYKYMGIFALAQTNTPAGGQSGPVATENIKWDGSVSYARLLWNHPTMTTITDQWNGATVAAPYTAMTLMDPATLATSPAKGSYKYPTNNWYNYYFYAYYPRVENITEENNVVTANFELDGSQDIITGYATPPALQLNNGYCTKYFSELNRANGEFQFGTQPQLQLTHHLAQLRFFVCSEDDPDGTFQVKGITLLDMPKEWALTIADKSNVNNTGTLTSLSATTTTMPVRTMEVDGSNNVTSTSDVPFFDGNTYKNLTTTPAIAGYAMVPTTAMITDANTLLNREFSTTCTVQLIIKSGDVEFPLTRTITTPTGGFVSGKVYNVIIKIDQASIVSSIPQAIDLGLSVKWANMNVGATSETDYGDYFAWGATTPFYSSLNPLTWKTGKEDGYVLENSSYYNGDGSNFSWSKYTSGSVTLQTIDDAARANWGGTWRMPTDADFQELINNTSYTWYSDYNSTGVAGYLLTSTKAGYTDKSIFLPAAGHFNGTSLNALGLNINYWTSKLYSDVRGARNFYFHNYVDPIVGFGSRQLGLTIRPVCQ